VTLPPEQAGELRLAAWELLRSGAPVPLRELEAVAEAHRLSPRDRALVRRLVTVVQRRLGTLRALCEHFAPRRPKPDLAAFVHLGLAQLFFVDRIPDHAAVSETVSAAHRALDSGRARFVNALLRNAARARRQGPSDDPRRQLEGTPWHLDTPFTRDPEQHPYLWFEDALSLPSRLARAFDDRLGRERTLELARSALRDPPLSVRAVEPDLEGLAIELQMEDLEPLAVDGCTLLFAPEDLERLLGSDAFRAGRLTVQGGTATRAAQLVEARPGERVLDLCAAPGGKTAVLAGAGARVVACDVDEQKLYKLRDTLLRLRLEDRVELVLSDGTRSLAEAGFDAVLVDAPCSNTGVLAARPEARWRFGPQHLDSLRQLQARLLREGADRVRIGGRLVWSTCSLEPSENVAQVKALLQERPGWKLESSFEALPDLDSGPVDGGYAARLVRSQ
jgi:16S rRNA (cytosine967-C5)-methyltransferase